MIKTIPARVLRAARKRLSGTDGAASERFRKTDFSEETPWSDLYRSGDYRALWDHSYPSPELVGYVFGARLGARARVLDVGCGSGQDAVFLASQNFEVHGLDFSAEALRLAERRARERGVAVSWHHSSVLSTPFDAGYFDLVTDRSCFHHIGGPRRPKYSEEIARILKPGGVLLLRGSRRPDPPFFPIDSDTIPETFDGRLFEIGPDVPFFLRVDGGGLEATLVKIVRRSEIVG
jgi:2-polyprenyl-3-methyl-5-hydroxy-6-metoxy-1,4-benzoquinol methylase